MDSEKRTGIQISGKAENQKISIINGGIKIAASGKAVSGGFGSDPGWIYMMLDCSTSMRGSKLTQAKAGVIDFAKDAFKKGYRVGFIKFGDYAEHLCDPTNDITVLQNKIKDIRADGWTNLTAALKIARSKLNVLTGSRVIVVATDGQPDDVDSSLEEAYTATAEGIDVIAIGTDDADNKFLKKLASRAELANKVASDKFGQAITEASLLLMSPRSLKPK